MPMDNVIPLFPDRDPSRRWRRRVRSAFGVASAVAIAFAPVTAVADGASRLPPGHPPVESQPLPPGHPPLGHGGEVAECSPELPQGHPAVRDPRLPEGHPPVEIRPCGPGSSQGVFHPEMVSPAPVPGLVET